MPCICCNLAINMKNCLSFLFVSQQLPLSFPSALFCTFFSPLWCGPLFFRAAMLFAIIRETNEKQERERESERASGLVSSHHHHSLYSPASPPSLSFSPLHLSVFLSDSWQPVGYSGHANPSVQIFAKWLEKIHIWMWLTHACCGSVSPVAALFWAARTHAAHITAHRALRPLKHATVRPQNACKWIRWDGLEAEAT